MHPLVLVIKISDETYSECQADKFPLNIIWELVDAVLKGTPLPKGHGRLIDMKNLQKFVSRYTEYDAIQLILANREDYIPTIIEVDEESEVRND